MSREDDVVDVLVTHPRSTTRPLHTRATEGCPQRESTCRPISPGTPNPPVSFGATVTGGDLMFVRRVISPVDVVDKKSKMSLAKGLPDYCRDAILRPHRTV